ncbi:MAG: adenine phosphoribosyltransferase [Sedimentisphaerales bacterium]|nr:adenine phosphoribosyltransferase [Sedimentisphaerales bacterium]
MPDGHVNLAKYIREIPDWPVKGVLFRDITPLLADAAAFKASIDVMIVPFAGRKIDYVAAVESRGFIFGAAIAAKLNAGFVPIRKRGKLPFKTKSVTYDLEYGTDTVEIHTDAFGKGAQVLLVDDLLATGGTMCAATQLVEKIGGTVVGITFLIELVFLHGRDKLASHTIKTVITY